MTGTTVLVGLGPFGAQVLARVEQSLGDVRRVALVPCAGADDVGTQVAASLERLLEAGREEAETASRRLDLFVFAVATQGDDDALWQTAAALGELVGRRYAVMFDLRKPPEQRNAALHMVVWVPPLGDNEQARKAMSRLHKLESWAESGVGNLLARVWLLPQLTQAGSVRAPGMVASAAAFVLATLGSGMREQPDVSELLAHPRGGTGRFGFLSVASLDVPEAAVRRYATLRAVYDGLQTLLLRAQGQRSIDSDAGMAAVESLPHRRWVAPFEEGGDLNTRVRKLAATLSGASSGLPRAVSVSAFDDAAKVRETHAALFRAAAVDKDMGAVDEQHVEGILRELDQQEAALVREIEVGLSTLFDRKLRAGALRTLPEVEIGLRHLAARLQDRDERNAARLAEEKGPPDPYRSELERAVSSLPDTGVLRTAALSVGLTLGFLAYALIPAKGAVPAATAGASLPGTTLVTTATSAAPPSFPVEDLVPWGVGVVVAILAAVAWGWASAHLSREELRRVLAMRLDAVQALWAKGGGGRRGRQAEDQLELRRHRVRRVARAAVEDALERIRCVQLAIGDARDRVREQLDGMSVHPTADASTDDLSRLGGEPDLLHDQLVPSPIVARWAKDARELAGDDDWADRLLARGWTSSDAADDVPCADLAVLEAAGREQVAALGRSPLLAVTSARVAAADAVTTFVRRAVAALAPAVQPLREDWEPAGTAPRRLVLAPRIAQDTLAPALQSSPLEQHVLWVDKDLPRVVFVYAWEGFRTVEIGRGAGLLSRPGGAS